jgi:hypothetical protein
MNLWIANSQVLVSPLLINFSINLWKNALELTFLNLQMCTHCQIVILHIILGNVHSLFHHRKTLFVHLHICPLPCHPFLYFVNYPFPLCSPCSNFEQMLEGVVKWFSIPLLPIVQGDYTWRCICYWWKENGMCISKYWIVFVVENN